jgi:recombination protein RecT
MSAPQNKEVGLLKRKTDERVELVKAMLPAFRDAMPGEHEAKRLIRDGITAIRTVPKLIECTQESFLGALMTAAQLDLRPNVASLGQGWILPYESKRKRVTEAQWIIGYRGMVELGARSGVTITARTIFSNEEHEVQFGLDERLHHIPILDRSKRGEPIIHYAIARSSTGVGWVAIGHDDALEARDNSAGYKFGGPDNPWRKFELPMCRKTAVRRLWSFTPTSSPQLAMGIASDETVRTDLDPDALEQMDGTPEPQTYTMTSVPDDDHTRADVVQPEPSKSADKPKAEPGTFEEFIAKFDEGVEYSGDRPDMKLTSNVWHGLVIAFVEKFGDKARDVLTERMGGEEIPIRKVNIRELREILNDRVKPVTEKARTVQPDSEIRRGLIKQLNDKHGEHAMDAVDVITGGGVEAKFITIEEIMAAIKVDPSKLG